MGLVQLIFHVFGLLLPALVMAVCMPLAGRWVMGPVGVPWPRRMLLHACAGVLVLALGLVVQGHDGRMSTYAVLVLVAASLEWLLHRR